MLNRVLKFGSAAGVIVAIPTFGIFTLLRDHAPGGVLGMAIGYTIMLVAFSMVFVGVKRYRDEDLGGVVRFWPALLLGLGISLVASVFYVLAWEAALAVTGIDFAGAYGRSVVEAAHAEGRSPAEIARLGAEMAQFRVQYADPLFRLPMTFTEILPVGVLVSLVSAGLLRNSRFLAARRNSFSPASPYAGS